VSNPASPEYKLVAAESIRSKIRRFAQIALHAGRQGAFRVDLYTVQRLLVTCPLEWGDPLYRLRAMDLMVYHGISEILNVHYAVDETRRIVYLMEVALMPKAGFGQDPSSDSDQ
jgi:hypothetical protein